MLPSSVSPSPLEFIDADVLPAQLRELIEAEGDVDPSLEEIEQVLDVCVQSPSPVVRARADQSMHYTLASTSRKMSNVTSTSSLRWRSKFGSGRKRRKPSPSSLWPQQYLQRQYLQSCIMLTDGLDRTPR